MKLLKEIIKSIIIFSFLIACSATVEESTTEANSSGIGKETGSASTVSGYNYSGEKEVDVSIQPYTNGFKITFTPVSSPFICSLSNNYVIQNGNQFDFHVADTKDDYDSLPSYYEGYVESGSFDNCGTYVVPTVWVILADEVGFTPTESYIVLLDDVDDQNGDSTSTQVNP